MLCAVGTDFTRRLPTVRFRHNIDVSMVTESSRQVCYSDCRFERLLCGTASCPQLHLLCALDLSCGYARSQTTHPVSANRMCGGLLEQIACQFSQPAAKVKTMKRILIVDDDEDVLIRLEHTLEAEGYSTATAWSGREALSLAHTADFDLLLIDEHLSDLDSTVVVEKLSQLQPHASLLLMQARRKRNESSPHPANPVVCKWEDEDVKARVRNSLAA